MRIKLIEDAEAVKNVLLTVSPEEYIVISSALKQFAENPNNVLVDIMTAKQMRIDICNRALEQEPRKWHWISHREHCENLGVMPSGLGAYKWCSNCDCGIDVREWHKNHYNYCPKCGARMVEPQESEG